MSKPGCTRQANRCGTDGYRRGHQTRPRAVRQEHRHRKNELFRCAQGFYTTRPRDRSIAQVRERARTGQLNFSCGKPLGKLMFVAGMTKPYISCNRSRALPTSHHPACDAGGVYSTTHQQQLQEKYKRRHQHTDRMLGF